MAIEILEISILRFSFCLQPPLIKMTEEKSEKVIKFCRLHHVSTASYCMKNFFEVFIPVYSHFGICIKLWVNKIQKYVW